MSRGSTGVVLVFAAAFFALADHAGAQSVTEPAAATREECAARLRAASEAGSEGTPRLRDVCVELAREIEAGVWAPALGAANAEDLTARPFEDLVDLIEDYERAPHEIRLAVDDLASIVESLQPFEPVAELSLWDRIREWARGFGDSSGPGGLIEWLRNLSIPEEWVRTIVYVLAVTIVLGALFVLVNELRLSGVLGGPVDPARAHGKRAIVPAWAKRVPLTFDGVRKAAPARQPALLLAMLVERLRARFGDAFRDSLTHRELAKAAGALGLRHRDELEAVAAAAERVIFAGWRPEPADVELVIAKGKAVLDELEADAEPVTTSP